MEISTKNNIVVYAHEHDGVTFYIGKGSCYRPLDPRNRNKIWRNFVKKIDSYHIKILKHFESDKDAAEFEKQKIREFKPACNILYCKLRKTTSKKQQAIKMSMVRLTPELGESLTRLSHQLLGEINLSFAIRYCVQKYFEKVNQKENAKKVS